MHAAGDVVLRAEGVDGLNVRLGKLEVERLQVALDAAGSERLGEDNVAAGGVPVQKDLSGSLVVLLGNSADGGILELVAASEGRVGLDLDAVLVAELDESLTLAERVDLDLVDSGDNLGVVDKILEVGGTEVGDTDGADLTQTLGGLKGAPRLKTLLLILSRRVDQVEVEVVKTELVEGRAKGVEGSLVAVVGIPELRADVDLLTGSVGFLHPGADGTSASLLVGITGSGVDMAVAGVKSGSDGILSLLAVGSLVDTEGDLRDGGAVVQRDLGNIGVGGDGRAVRSVGLVDDSLLGEDLTLGGGLGGDSDGSHDEGCISQRKGESLLMEIGVSEERRMKFLCLITNRWL